MNVFDQLGNNPVIPVIVLDDVDAAVPMAEALVEAGVTALEVTLRTPAALEVIEVIAKKVPQAIVGAGTVVSAVNFQQILDVGARFAVSPGLSENLAVAAKDSGLPWLPGIVTSGEIIRAKECGFTELKFFPASVAGGPPALKGFASVFQDVTFCPTGGVSPQNMAEYLTLGNVSAVGGSWLVTAEDIRSRNWSGIAATALAARKQAEEILGA